MIINLPKNMAKETTHRYGPNAFKLHRYVRTLAGHEHSYGPMHCVDCTCLSHVQFASKCRRGRLPTPRPGQVLGLVGTNGIGKSTALKILAGKLKPNLGRFDVHDKPAFLTSACFGCFGWCYMQQSDLPAFLCRAHRTGRKY